MANLVKQLSSDTSGTVTCSDTKQDVQILHDAGVTLTLTIALPANPTDGQKVGIVSVGGITTLSITAAVGTIIGVITTFAALGGVTYMYSASNTKWYKIA